MYELLEIGKLILLVNRFVNWFVKPVFEKYNLDQFWLKYISWVLGGLLVWLTGVNLFAELFPAYPIVGQVLSAAIAGGGANLLSDFAKKKPDETVIKVSGDLVETKVVSEQPVL